MTLDEILKEIKAAQNIVELDRQKLAEEKKKLSELEK